MRLGSCIHLASIEAVSLGEISGDVWSWQVEDVRKKNLIETSSVWWSIQNRALRNPRYNSSISQHGCVSEIPWNYYESTSQRIWKCLATKHKVEIGWCLVIRTALLFHSQRRIRLFSSRCPNRIWIGRRACLGSVAAGTGDMVQGQLAKTLADEKESNAFRMAS